MTATAPAQTERAFQQQVVQYARLRGWKCYWTWNSKHSPAGWPDLFCLRGSECVAAELKRENGKLRPAQEETLAALVQVEGISVFVWRPSDWPVIEAVLA